MAPTPVVKDPTHPDFPHGQPRGYYRGCRCDGCGRARRAADKRRTLMARRGIPAMTPVGPVVEHMRRLIEETGTTPNVLSRAAGVERNLCQRALRGTRKTIDRRAAQKILGLRVEDVAAASVCVDKTEAVRLVRCLQAQGWPLRWIATELGYGPTSMPQFLYQGFDVVTVTLMRRVQALADRVGDATGPSPKSAAAARRLGFYPLIAYDDDGVLHREWLADEAGGTRGTARRETLSGDWLRCLSLSFAGRSIVDIAGITGLSERTVQRARDRLGIRFAVSDEWGSTVPAPGQEAEVTAGRRVLAEWDGGGVEARAAWKALMRAVAAARGVEHAEGGVEDDEAA